MIPSVTSGVQVVLKRRTASEPWGIRLAGGKDEGLVIKLAKVTPMRGTRVIIRVTAPMMLRSKIMHEWCREYKKLHFVD